MRSCSGRACGRSDGTTSNQGLLGSAHSVVSFCSLPLEDQLFLGPAVPQHLRPESLLVSRRTLPSESARVVASFPELNCFISLAESSLSANVNELNSTLTSTDRAHIVSSLDSVCSGV